jgi:hypothetical protein
MKFALGAGLCCLLTAGVFAQHRGGGASGHAVSVGGRARVGFTSGIRAGGGIGRIGRAGYMGFRGFRGYYGSYWPWFYGYPGLWDSSYDDSYDSGYPYGGSYESAPNVTVVYAPPAEPVYPTVVTLTAHPVMHEYRQPEDYGLPSEHASQPVLYLIAFNDHIIRAATTYWVENGKLRYLDTDHKQKEAPLSSVDRDFSAELNRERRVPFRLQ